MNAIEITGTRCVLKPRPTAFLPISKSSDDLLIPIEYPDDSPPVITVNYHEDRGYYITDFVNIYDVKPANISDFLYIRDSLGIMRKGLIPDPFEACVFFTENDIQRGVILTASTSSFSHDASFSQARKVYDYFRVTNVTESSVTLTGIRTAIYSISSNYRVLTALSFSSSDGKYIVTPPTEEVVLRGGPASYNITPSRNNQFRFQAEPKLGNLIAPRFSQTSTDDLILRTYYNNTED